MQLISKTLTTMAWWQQKELEWQNFEITLTNDKVANDKTKEANDKTFFTLNGSPTWRRRRFHVHTVY